MSAIDLSAITRQQYGGSGSVDATLTNNLITLPAWVRTVDLYLADTAGAGTFALSDPTRALPLPKETWVRVLEPQPGNPVPTTHLWAASNTGSVTLYIKLS